MEIAVIAHIDIDALAAWATLATAGATAGLAIATFMMAARTNAMAAETGRTAEAAQQELQVVAKQAEATQRQTEIAEAALGASIRPLIVDVPLGTFREVAIRRFGEDADEGPTEIAKTDVSEVFVVPDEQADPDDPWRYLTVDVPFRNVGAGVAIVVDARLAVPLDAQGEIRAFGVSDQQALPPGEATYVRFESSLGDTDHGPTWDAVMVRGAEVRAEIFYTDLAGQQRSRTDLHLRPLTSEGESYFVYHANTALVDHNPLGTPWG